MDNKSSCIISPIVWILLSKISVVVGAEALESKSNKIRSSFINYHAINSQLFYLERRTFLIIRLTSKSITNWIPTSHSEHDLLAYCKNISNGLRIHHQRVKICPKLNQDPTERYLGFLFSYYYSLPIENYQVSATPRCCINYKIWRFMAPDKISWLIVFIFFFLVYINHSI